jgi:hypothetical protein
MFIKILIITIFSIPNLNFAMEEKEENAVDRFHKDTLFHAMITAVKRGDSKTLHETLSRPNSININTRRFFSINYGIGYFTTALEEAIASDNPAMIREIIEKYKGTIDQNILSLAVLFNKRTATEELLKLGANPNLKNNVDGKNAIEYSDISIASFKRLLNYFKETQMKDRVDACQKDLEDAIAIKKLLLSRMHQTAKSAKL